MACEHMIVELMAVITCTIWHTASTSPAARATSIALLHGVGGWPRFLAESEFDRLARR